MKEGTEIQMRWLAYQPNENCYRCGESATFATCEGYLCKPCYVEEVSNRGAENIYKIH